MENILLMGPHLLKPGLEVPSSSVTAESYKKGLKINISRNSESCLEFDIIGIYPGLINAFRRILLSEVPTMAIEKVHIYNNTSLIQDEVLAHRLGLIPLKADARFFDYHSPGLPKYTDKDSLQFEIKISCTKNPHARYGHHRPEDKYVNHNVYSKDIKWVPLEGQESLFKEESVGPVHPDILIAKLRPGQVIHTTLIAAKGIGKDHAKFSPVATASYRLHPYIELKEEVEGKLAETLQSCFSPGVIGIKEFQGKKKAFVENARLDMCSRNFYRYEDLNGKVIAGRISNHYIFTIESTVGLTSDELFKETIKILKKKCIDAIDKLKDLLK